MRGSWPVSVGKKSDTANYQDELTGALIGLSRAVRKKLALNPDASFEHADELILKGLFTTITNVNFSMIRSSNLFMK